MPGEIELMLLDFFMKTFHHDHYLSATQAAKRKQLVEEKGSSSDHYYYHDNLWCVSADETKAFFENCEVPWIAYKVLAPVAIKTKDGLRFAWENGADFTCVGMSNFQIVENAGIVYEILHNPLTRQRKWFA